MLRLFYAIALCCVLILPSEAYAATAVGSVVTVSGDAQVERAGKRVAITLHQAVFQSDTIITGAKGRVKLTMIDKSKVYIGSRTKILLSKYDVGDKGFIQASLDMAWGKARFFVNKLVSRKSSFEVRTSTAVLGVRGTGWLTEVANGQTFVTQFEGVLSVQTAQGTFSVQHGQVASIDVGGVFSVRPATRREMSRQKIDPDIGDNAMGSSSGHPSSGNEKKGKNKNTDKAEANKPQAPQPKTNNNEGSSKGDTTINVPPVVAPQRKTAVLVPKGFTPATTTNTGGGSGTPSTSQPTSQPTPVLPPPPAPPPVVIQNATQQAKTAVRIQPSFVLP